MYKFIVVLIAAVTLALAFVGHSASAASDPPAIPQIYDGGLRLLLFHGLPSDCTATATAGADRQSVRLVATGGGMFVTPFLLGPTKVRAALEAGHPINVELDGAGVTARWQIDAVINYAKSADFLPAHFDGNPQTNSTATLAKSGDGALAHQVGL